MHGHKSIFKKVLKVITDLDHWGGDIRGNDSHGYNMEEPLLNYATKGVPEQGTIFI